MNKAIILKGCTIFFILIISVGLLSAENRGVKRKYDPIVRSISSKYSIDPQLVHSIILAESNYDPRAISPKGAVGLMQLMPQTAIEFGVKNPYDPEENIEGGVTYIKYLCNLFNHKIDLVLAAYNAGQEAIEKYGGIPPYPETKKYVKKVLGTYGKDKIQRRTIIYKYYDKNGRVVLTNNKTLFLMNKR